MNAFASVQPRRFLCAREDLALRRLTIYLTNAQTTQLNNYELDLIRIVAGCIQKIREDFVPVDDYRNC